MAESVKELVAYGFIEGAPDFIFYNYLLHKPHTQIETKSSFCALFRRGVTFVLYLRLEVKTRTNWEVSRKSPFFSSASFGSVTFWKTTENCIGVSGIMGWGFP